MQKKLKTLKGNKIHNSYNKEFFLLFVLGHPEGILKEFTKKYNDHFEIQSKYCLRNFYNRFSSHEKSVDFIYRRPAWNAKIRFKK